MHAVRNAMWETPGIAGAGGWLGRRGKNQYFIIFHNPPACAVARRGSWVGLVAAESIVFQWVHSIVWGPKSTFCSGFGGVARGI